MLTLQIDGDENVNQTKGEETMNTTNYNTSEPESAPATSQDPVQNISNAGNGADAEPQSKAFVSANLATGQFENLAAIQRTQMEAIAKASRTLMEGMIAINREAADYRHQRAQAIVGENTSVPSLAELSKIMDFQISYVDRATQAYLEEASKLFELGLKIAEESFVPLQESTNQALREMLDNDQK